MRWRRRHFSWGFRINDITAGVEMSALLRLRRGMRCLDFDVFQGFQRAGPRVRRWYEDVVATVKAFCRSALPGVGSRCARFGWILAWAPLFLRNQNTVGSSLSALRNFMIWAVHFGWGLPLQGLLGRMFGWNPYDGSFEGKGGYTWVQGCA